MPDARGNFSEDEHLDRGRLEAEAAAMFTKVQRAKSVSARSSRHATRSPHGSAFPARSPSARPRASSPIPPTR